MGRWIISRKLVACATCAVVAAAGVVVLSPYVSVKDEKPISSDVDKEMVAEIVWRTRNADGLKAYERHDYDTALKLLRPLAEEGDAEALYVLGTMYQNGMGVLKDGALASHWFALARRWRVLDANKGDRAAQMRLAIMLELGQGGAVDLVSANMWFNIAASAAHERGEKSDEFIIIMSQDLIKGARVRRDMIELRMKPSEIARAQELARKCLASNYKQCGTSEATIDPATIKRFGFECAASDDLKDIGADETSRWHVRCSRVHQ